MADEQESTDPTDRIPGTVISRTFVAQLIRDFCHFVCHPETENATDDQQVPLEERMKLLRELCDSEPVALPSHLSTEFAPIIRSIIQALSSLIELDESPQTIPDNLLVHFFGIVASLIKFDFGTLIINEGTDQSSDGEALLALCIGSIGRMAPALMTATFECIIQILSIGPSQFVPLKCRAVQLLAHQIRLPDLVAFVLPNSLSTDLVRTVWQLLYVLSGQEMAQIMQQSLMPGLLDALNCVILTDPSFLEMKKSEEFKNPASVDGLIPLRTMRNLLCAQLNRLQSCPATNYAQLAALLIHRSSMNKDDGTVGVLRKYLSEHCLPK